MGYSFLHYKLVDQTPAPCTFQEYVDWEAAVGSEKARRVAKTYLEGAYISTVFLGLDHSFGRDTAAPVLFETMVFEGPLDGMQERYTTWADAEIGHKAMVECVKHRSTRLWLLWNVFLPPHTDQIDYMPAIKGEDPAFCGSWMMDQGAAQEFGPLMDTFSDLMMAVAENLIFGGEQ